MHSIFKNVTSQLKPPGALGIKKPPARFFLRFCLTFPEYEWGTRCNCQISIGHRKLLGMLSNTHELFWNWRTFTLILTHPAGWFKSKYYCNSSDKSKVFLPRQVQRNCAQINATLTDNRKWQYGYPNLYPRKYDRYHQNSNSNSACFRPQRARAIATTIDNRKWQYVLVAILPLRTVRRCRNHLTNEFVCHYSKFWICSRNFDAICHISRDISISGFGSPFRLSLLESPRDAPFEQTLDLPLEFWWLSVVLSETYGLPM